MGATNETTFTVTIDPKKVHLPIMELKPKVYKNTPHVTKAEIYRSWGGGGNNKEVLENRELFWKLKKSIDPTVEPAEISRVALVRLVIDHMALSKGKVLQAECGTRWKMHSIHRDYTAWVMGDDGKMVLLDEEQLRQMVKTTKKAEKKGGAGKKEKDPKLCETCGWPAEDLKIPLDKKTATVKVPQQLLNQLGKLNQAQALSENRKIPAALSFSGAMWVVTGSVSRGENCLGVNLWRSFRTTSRITAIASSASSPPEDTKASHAASGRSPWF